jgi:hypothetical protein
LRIAGENSLSTFRLVMDRLRPCLLLTLAFILVQLSVLYPLLSCHSTALAFSSGEEDLNPQDSSEKKHYLRATIETLTLLGLVSAHYWATLIYEEDFDYDFSLETAGKKLNGEALRFDDNDLENNSFPGHPLAGAYYYLIARNYNLSRAESFLWSFTSSYLHEAFIEFPEVLSINDMIATPFAGTTIGEAMYQLGKYLRCTKNRNTIVNKMMSAVVDPIHLWHSIIWKDVDYISSVEEACDYTTFQSDFSLFSGMSTVLYESTDQVKTGLILGAHGKVYLLPHYGQESDINRFFTDTALVELALEINLTDEGIDNVTFYAKTLWAAYHRQKISKDHQGNVRGYSFFAGPASAFEHIQYETGDFEDAIGAVHLLGPAMELAFFQNNSYIRIGVDIFGDFAMVRSFALPEYAENHALDGIKSVLQKRKYYYAFGVTVNPKIEIRRDPYRFITEYKYSYYDSFEGADRRGDVPNDFNLIDQREEYRVAFGRLIDFIDAKFFKKHQIWAEAEVRRRSRTGFIADDAVTHDGSNTWFLMRIRISPF